jgi:hypothetical protein
MATENGLYSITSTIHNGIIPISTIHNGIIPNNLQESLKLLNLRPALYILMHKAVILHTCCIARTFLVEQ